MDYKPDNKEVAKELIKGYADSLRRTKYRLTNNERVEQYKESLSKFCKGLGDVLKAASTVQITPYVIPTLHRKMKEEEKFICIPKRINDASLPLFMGIQIGCMAGGAVQMMMYIDHAEKHPEIILIPIVSNLASLAYEQWRKAKKRLVEKRGLEGRLE